MSTITEYYYQSQLALASYSDLSSGMSYEDYTTALVADDDGMSLTQAQTFASNWRVIDQQPNTASGFSATVFQSVADNSYVLSIRGTETSPISAGLIDWSTNLGDIGVDGLAIAQAIDLFNYYQRLTARQGEDIVQYTYYPAGIHPDATATINYTTTTATADGELAGKHVTIAGHSLGGHLALIMSRLAPDFVDSVTTINAPGFDPISSSRDTEAFFTLLRDAETAATGGSAISTAWETAKLNNLRMEGDIVSAVGTLFGTTQTATAEDSDPLGAHSIQNTTDSLAVYNLFANIDSSLSIEAITGILLASASKTENSLESAVSTLGELLVDGFTPRTGSEYDSNRDDLYKDVQSVTAAVSSLSNLEIKSLETTDSGGDITPLSSTQIETLAKGDIACRYELNLSALNIEIAMSEVA